MRELVVHKVHGTHNEFVLIDERPPRYDRYEALAQALCDPGCGVGADGLLVVRDHESAAAEMRIFNADGSEAEMCGNGVRCVARFLAERGAPRTFVIATHAGPVDAEIVSREPFVVRVGVGTPSFPSSAREETLAAHGQGWHYIAVSVGNPHVVVFVDDVEADDLARVGAAIAADPRFPQGTNVHVATLVDPARLRVRHYERGVGLTQSCGTGAAAAAAAAIRTRGATSPLTVEVPGGTLEVDWNGRGPARLTGPAEVLFERAISP